VKDFLEPYIALKSLRKKTVLFAQAILDVEIKNEDKDTDNEVFSDAKDGIFTNKDRDGDYDD
jgi:predicted transcriptional regulator